MARVVFDMFNGKQSISVFDVNNLTEALEAYDSTQRVVCGATRCIRREWGYEIIVVLGKEIDNGKVS